MMYKLIHKYIGTQQSEIFAEIEINALIDDICSVNNLGYFFLANQCMGYINTKGEVYYPFIGQEGVKGINETGTFKEQIVFSNPSSICYDAFRNVLFVLEDNGKTVRTINLGDNYYSIGFLKNEWKSVFDKIFSNSYPIGKTAITSENGNVCWLSEFLNRVFYTNEKMVVLGNPTEGYATSNHENGFCFNCPSGVIIKDGILYVSDKKNHCIRSFGLNSYYRGVIDHSVICGHPLNSTIEPEKIIFVNKSLFFIDKKSVYLNRIISGESAKIYSPELSGSVASICLGLQANKLSILIQE